MRREGSQPRLRLRIIPHVVTVTSPGWQGMQIGPAVCQVTVDGRKRKLHLVQERRRGGGRVLSWRSTPKGILLTQTVSRESPGRLRWRSELGNAGGKTVRLNGISLLTIEGVPRGRFDLGTQLAQVRIMEQSAYAGRVRSVGQILTGLDGRKGLDDRAASFVSTAVMVAFSPAEGRGVLIGFETFDRWAGQIRGGSARDRTRLESDVGNKGRGAFAARNAELKPGQRLREWSVGFAGGDVPIEPGQALALEEFVIQVGRDPFRMLDDYADRVAARYGVRDLPRPFANWCSWYPYRLGVTDELVLANARAARERHLDRLGLRFIQADLGWEKDNVPTYFEENERFSHGLKWLSTRLRRLGFELGVWKGFTCVSENHPIARDHPDWLVKDERGKPVSAWRWFWEPHDVIYALDSTHPEALAWVRENIESLARRGVRYLKWDFGGNLTARGRRHDSKVCPLEGARRVCRVVQEAMNSRGEEGLVLDCTSIELGGLGLFKMIYANMDTGNTGIGFKHLREVYTSFATHLFKNHRWALLQPSCLVVGLPGTLEEARVRATATFMGAGHVDIGDDLTTLPEERWGVLLSALPPLQTPARVVDLFYPIRISSGSYEALCRAEKVAGSFTDEPQGAGVWHARIASEWDEWHLVGVFNLFDPDLEDGRTPLPRRFDLPFGLLGLEPDRTYWAREFWSGQFLGSIPVPRKPYGAYRHPGDAQGLLTDGGPGVLALTFHGPSVKLLAIRKPRRHPWPVGTTFHLSGGRELSDVRWDAREKTLSGRLHRPPGQYGAIIVAGARDPTKVTAEVSGAEVATQVGASGSVCIPVATRDGVTHWRLAAR